MLYQLSTPPWSWSPQPQPQPPGHRLPAPPYRPFTRLREDNSSMTSTDRVTVSKQLNTREISESAVAMLDDHGTVVAWTQAAEQLLGYSAGDVMGRSAALVQPSSEETPTISAFIEQRRAQNDRSGMMPVRHRDGRMLNLNHRISMLWGQDGTVRWLVSATDIGTLSQDTGNGSVRESLLTHAPIGVVVRDTQLRCTWVNETIESR